MERKPKAERRLLTVASAQCEKRWEDGILAITTQLPVGLSSHPDGIVVAKAEGQKVWRAGRAEHCIIFTMLQLPTHRAAS